VPCLTDGDSTIAHQHAVVARAVAKLAVADWGLALDRKQLQVDTEKFQTSEVGILAVGDINTYPGKRKLIVSGFHEATLAAFAAAEIVFPNTPTQLLYTTTSTLLLKRLGRSVE
jgi:thioredoxin reductase (NADPH)